MQNNNGGLEKTQFINMIIFSGLILAIMMFFRYSNEHNKEVEKKEVEKKEKELVIKTINTNTGEKTELESRALTIQISNSGGQISSAKLNHYNSYDKDDKNKPLYLFNNQNSSYGFIFKDKSGKEINTRDLKFTPSLSGNSLTMQSEINDAKIQFIYTLNSQGDAYEVNFQVKTEGLSRITNDTKAGFAWNYQVINAEKGRTQEQGYTEFVYSFDNLSNYDTDARSELDEKEETLDWIGVKQQFFAVVLEAEKGLTQSTGNQEIIEKGEYLKHFDYNAEINLSANKELNNSFTWYFLPLEMHLLESYEKNFEDILPLGWSFIRTINVWFFIPIYEFIAQWGIEAGWAIFILTIIVKIILSPIMFKQHKLSAMMRVIRPEVDAINEKYKDADPLKKQQEVMNVYRNAGVNQLAGCIPALLQLPIFYALFRFFPNYIDFRGQGFWFAEDLSSYDDIIKLPFHVPAIGEHLSIFALACTVVILIYTIMTSGNVQTPQQEGMPNMKPFMYIFPIMFMFFLNTAASGLSWYYFVSNALNIVIILVIKYLILDEKKIHAQIQENKTKPKKENRFQRKMRELMEQAQEAKKEQEKNKK